MKNAEGVLHPSIEATKINKHHMTKSDIQSLYGDKVLSDEIFEFGTETSVTQTKEEAVSIPPAPTPAPLPQGDTNDLTSTSSTGAQ